MRGGWGLALPNLYLYIKISLNPEFKTRLSTINNQLTLCMCVCWQSKKVLYHKKTLGLNVGIKAFRNTLL